MERKHIVVGNTFLCRKIYGLLKIILRLRVYTIDNREKKSMKIVAVTVRVWADERLVMVYQYEFLLINEVIELVI